MTKYAKPDKNVIQFNKKSLENWGKLFLIFN